LNVNFWYPTVSKATLQILFEKMQNGFTGNSCEDCAALLVLALGAASELIKVVHSSGERRNFESRQHQSELMAMAAVCFDEAMKLLTVAHMEISTISTQCVFLAAFVKPLLPCPKSPGTDRILVYIVHFFNGPYKRGATSTQLLQNVGLFSPTGQDLEISKMRSAFAVFFGLVISSRGSLPLGFALRFGENADRLQ
jgi:hypothetical protein